MAMKTSSIIWVNFDYRNRKTWDAFRAWVFKDGKNTSIPAKAHPTWERINKCLKEKALTEEFAEKDPEFITMKQRLEHELRSEYGLATYKAIERIEMKPKEFDFEDSLETFFIYKSNTSQPVTYRNYMRDFWLPFFVGKKNCIHPSEFIEHREEAFLHVKSARTQRGNQPLSFHSYNGFSKALNQFMDFLVKTKKIGPEAQFSIWIMTTKEEIKRGKL